MSTRHRKLWNCDNEVIEVGDRLNIYLGGQLEEIDVPLAKYENFCAPTARHLIKMLEIAACYII
jgi:hypothetical protein